MEEKFDSPLFDELISCRFSQRQTSKPTVIEKITKTNRSLINFKSINIQA